MATAQELAQELVAIRGQIAELKTQESDVVERLAAEMPEKRLEVPGLGVFERHKSSSRKTWDNDGLQSALIRKLRAGSAATKRVDENGEVIAEDDVERTARVVFECARPSWRLTPLRSLDLDPDEYSEVTYDGTYTVQFTGSA